MKFLLWCANVHVNFRIAELKALAALQKIPVTWLEDKICNPYVTVDLKRSEDAEKLVKHSMLVRSCYEIWGEGESIDKLHENLERNIPIFKNQVTNGKDFKVEVITFNKKITREEKHRKVMSLSYIPVKGKVNLTNPELQMSLIEYYGISHNIPENPVKCFFGRWITDGQRDIINTFSLKKRRFIGTTSMDAELAFLMANMAQVGPGNVVFDPFVGTGSILVSAAQRGAYVLGCDIDFMTLHAKTKPTRFQEKERKEDESIRANLEQYGLGGKYLDILVMDSSRHLWRKTKFIDAIITDPPYGIRESTERVGCDKERKRKLSGEEDQKLIRESGLIHYPPKINYNIADIMIDLLNFAADHLKLGGRLVFWLPVFREDYSEKLIPQHPCLQLEHNCEQILSTYCSRRLITLVKWKEVEEGESASAEELKRYEDFKRKFMQASQTLQSLSKEERKAIKKKFPMDKRGQGYSNNEDSRDILSMPVVNISSENCVQRKHENDYKT
ncbi:UNVERIFIED_CONTAM: hypothetical protein RMT77_010393 [Armadillidium vulgare]